jgi:hypothetical protein
MSRSIIAGLAVLAGAASIAAPAITGTAAASAKPTVVYGFAWADGPGTLRITPHRPRLVKLEGTPTYRLSPIKGAKELRVGYTGADFRRVTAECGLKETEGVVRLDGNGLGRTPCTDSDLTFALGLNPVPVRISLGPKVLVQEFLVSPAENETAYGTVRRVNDTTVLFRTGRKTVKLGYTLLTFERVTKRCGDPWLANRVNASRTGLGTKTCDQRSFAKALRTAGRPVRVKAYYDPLSGRLDQVWEVAPRR